MLGNIYCLTICQLLWARFCHSSSVAAVLPHKPDPTAFRGNTQVAVTHCIHGWPNWVGKGEAYRFRFCNADGWSIVMGERSKFTPVQLSPRLGFRYSMESYTIERILHGEPCSSRTDKGTGGSNCLSWGERKWQGLTLMAR